MTRNPRRRTPKTRREPCRLPILVYAAHPVNSYGTDHECRQLDRMAGLLPGVKRGGHAEIIDPATRYRDGVDWLLDWPGLVGTLSGLVVFGDETGTIGAGVLREIADALAHILPVACLDRFGTPRELSSVDFAPTMLRNPRQVATLSYGAVVDDLAGFLGVDPEAT